MADLKTKPTETSVSQYIAAIDDEATRRDCRDLVKIMQAATRARPKMWGSGIVGFGSYHYRYASGREGDWFLTGFSPRRRHLTIYIMSGFSDCGAILKRLGRHKTSKCCLHVKRLDDVDRGALAELVRRSVREVAKAHGAGAGK